MAMFCLLLPTLVSAQAVEHQPNLQGQIFGQLNAGAKGAEIENAKADPRALVASYVQLFLGFIGIIFLVLLIMSGYWLVTARGQEDKTEKATKTIRGAVIGLFIVMIAYSVTLLVGKAIQNTTGQIREGGERQTAGWYDRFNRCGARALGGLIPFANPERTCRYREE